VVVKQLRYFRVVAWNHKFNSQFSGFRVIFIFILGICLHYTLKRSVRWLQNEVRNDYSFLKIYHLVKNFLRTVIGSGYDDNRSTKWVVSVFRRKPKLFVDSKEQNMAV